MLRPVSCCGCFVPFTGTFCLASPDSSLKYEITIPGFRRTWRILDAFSSTSISRAQRTPPTWEYTWIDYVEPFFSRQREETVYLNSQHTCRFSPLSLSYADTKKGLGITWAQLVKASIAGQLSEADRCSSAR